MPSVCIVTMADSTFQFTHSQMGRDALDQQV